MRYTDFLDLENEPGEDELVCRFRARPRSDVDLEWAAGGIAAESSVGTWDPGLKTLEGVDLDDLRARVVDLDESTGRVEVAYPLDLFEAGNMAQILSSITGNVYGLKELERLRFLDLDVPREMAEAFPGPQLGLEGVRERTGVRDRPFVGTIVKPKLGLDADRWAQAAYDAWSGGLDVVKDDENLTSMTFNNFYERTEKVIALKEEAEAETGEEKLYFANCTAPISEMKERIDHVLDLGNGYVMLDILTLGWSGLQEARDHLEGEDVGIHAHRAQHGATTRLESHGIDFLAMAKWARLCGVDNVHAGTIGTGKMATEGGTDHNRTIYDTLREPWHDLDPVIPVASGGLHPGVLPALVEAAGPDFAAMAGGGVHGHPDGSHAGAQAMRRAMEAAASGEDIEAAAADHEALERALEKWGTQVVGG